MTFGQSASEKMAKGCTEKQKKTNKGRFIYDLFSHGTTVDYILQTAPDLKCTLSQLQLQPPVVLEKYM